MSRDVTLSKSSDVIFNCASTSYDNIFGSYTRSSASLFTTNCGRQCDGKGKRPVRLRRTLSWHGRETMPQLAERSPRHWVRISSRSETFRAGQFREIIRISRWKVIETLETFTKPLPELAEHVLVRVGATGFASATAIRPPERNWPSQLHPLKTGNYYRTLLEHRLPVDDQLILQFMSEGGDRDASTSFETRANQRAPAVAVLPPPPGADGTAVRSFPPSPGLGPSRATGTRLEIGATTRCRVRTMMSRSTSRPTRPSRMPRTIPMRSTA